MALRFGLVGTGYWAREVHAAALAATDEAELVGVWGRNPVKARATAEAHGAHAFGELAELLEAVDAVAFSVPPDVQAELAVRAATAGRHLLLEKPLALSLQAARRVVEAAEGNGVASVVFFTARFQPEVAEWVERARDAAGWHSAHCTWMGSIVQPDSPFGESPWRRDKGALWDVGPHALALMLPTLGPVGRLTAATGLGDTVHLVLGHRGGASSTVSLSLTAPPAAATTELVLYGAGGRSPMPRGSRTAVEALGEALRQLAAEAAAGSTAHPCGARFAAEVVAVLEAAERFLATPVDGRTAAVARY